MYAIVICSYILFCSLIDLETPGARIPTCPPLDPALPLPLYVSITDCSCTKILQDISRLRQTSRDVPTSTCFFQYLTYAACSCRLFVIIAVFNFRTERCVDGAKVDNPASGYDHCAVQRYGCSGQTNLPMRFADPCQSIACCLNGIGSCDVVRPTTGPRKRSRLHERLLKRGEANVAQFSFLCE